MRRPSQRNRVMSEINITPLTDVMMVLLVIFMVTTPLIMKASIDINLPKAHAQTTAPAPSVQITVSRDGKITVDGQSLRLEELPVFLSKRLKEIHDPQVTVSADEQVLYGDAVKVLDLARQAGAVKLVLAAEPLPAQALSAEILKP